MWLTYTNILALLPLLSQWCFTNQKKENRVN